MTSGVDRHALTLLVPPRQAKAELAAFIGAAPQDVVAVTNATAATAAVMASVPLGPGDWLLCTNMTYAAARARWLRLLHSLAGVQRWSMGVGTPDRRRPGARGSAQATVPGPVACKWTCAGQLQMKLCFDKNHPPPPPFP